MGAQTMWALVKDKAAPGLSLQKRPIPRVDIKGVLIRVKKAGICGTDLHIHSWDKWAQSRIKPGIIVGHEFMGEVVAVGDAVTSVQVGDRVSAEGHIGCGFCYCCRTGQGHICDRVDIIGVDIDGCFAEYIHMPESNVWKLHPSIPDHWGAIHDPLGNAVHTVMAGGSVDGRTVLVMGLGSIGLMCVMLCRAAGAVEVFGVDVNPRKMQQALDLGADRVFDARHDNLEQEILELTNYRRGVDVVLEVSGNAAAFRRCLHLVRCGGEVKLLGIPPTEVSLDLAQEVIFKGITLYGINGRLMFETWYQMENFLTRHKLNLDPLITHQLPMDKFEEAFGLLESGEATKIVLDVEGMSQ